MEEEEPGLEDEPYLQAGSADRQGNIHEEVNLILFIIIQINFEFFEFKLNFNLLYTWSPCGST